MTKLVMLKVVITNRHILSAEDVAKQNQADIAKYGLPPHANIISRETNLPQQYNRFVQGELTKHFKTSNLYGPESPSPSSSAASNATNILRSAGSIGADFIPGVSTAKGIQQALLGVDLVTGQQLSSVDRWAEVGGIAASLIPIPGAKLAGKAVTKHAIVGVSKAAEAISGFWRKASAKLSSIGKSTPKLEKAVAGDNVGIGFKGTGNTDIEVTIPGNRYPETSKHIQDAQKAGHPDILTIDRSGAKLRRRDSIGGLDKVPGKDLDEYPPAMFKEGGMGASVRPVSPSDNRGAGAYLGNKLRNYPDGTKVRIK